ncbi:Imm19 family immunity protein [uncultured Clostridium sp.]|uniref:Imm19 family immunity protein n=1 Tax=uncultured Clostridium sp. TaxID=59620 RepID=UPI0028E42BEC|nr:Imm19 family immunity protein [uncultured Clostridium sp.]
MRNIIDFESIKGNSNFWLLFFACNYPESFNEELEETLSEFLSEKFEFPKEFINSFTGYYDGVLDDSDGYVDDPNTLQLSLDTEKKLYIEFHPGDTMFFLDDNEIGCTGPHYEIHAISWEEFKKHTVKKDVREKLLLLPMVYVNSNDEIDELKNVLLSGLEETFFEKDDYNTICNEVIENCKNVKE